MTVSMYLQYSQTTITLSLCCSLYSLVGLQSTLSPGKYVATSEINNISGLLALHQPHKISYLLGEGEPRTRLVMEATRWPESDTNSD